MFGNLYELMQRDSGEDCGAWRLGEKGYLVLTRLDDGWEYIFLAPDYEELVSGTVGNLQAGIDDVRLALLFGTDSDPRNCPAEDYDQVMDRMEMANEAVKREKLHNMRYGIRPC